MLVLQTIREAVVGDCTNRWFDKSFSMLAFRSGLFGVHCDVSETIRAFELVIIRSLPWHLHYYFFPNIPWPPLVDSLFL